jgi:hypothetical protein
MTDLESYENLKKQQDNFQLELEELNELKDIVHDTWRASHYEDKKSFKKLDTIEKERIRIRGLSKNISYKLIILDYQETGITISELSKKYNIGQTTIKKLFKNNDIAYIPAQMVHWRPIVSAPKDGTFILVWFEEAQHHCILWWFADHWRFKGSDIIPIVDPTHWMPLPQPPKRNEDD